MLSRVNLILKRIVFKKTNFLVKMNFLTVNKRGFLISFPGIYPSNFDAQLSTQKTQSSN